MRDSELAADVTRPHSLVSHLHYPLPDDVWERAAVDENSSELVDSAMTWKIKSSFIFIKMSQLGRCFTGHYLGQRFHTSLSMRRFEELVPILRS